MTRKKALEILGLSETATQQDIQSAFSRKYSETNSRKIDAPELADKFEESLTRYRSAMKVLSTELVATEPTKASAYPSTRPVEVNQTASNKEIVSPSIGKGANEEELKSANKWKRIFLLTTILALSLAGFFLASCLEAKKELNGETVVAQKKFYDKYNGLIKNHNFKISNSSEDPFYLMGYQAIYLDAKGNIKRYPEHSHHIFKNAIEIKGKKNHTIDIVQINQDTIFPGKVFFYSILLMPEKKDDFKAYSGLVDDDKGISIDPTFYTND